jgi:NADH-quinone oxidoreductase subunit C
VQAADILKLMAHLNQAEDFKILVDLCGTDWPQRASGSTCPSFVVADPECARPRQAQVGEGESIASIIAIYPAAGWFERETFDMYGVAFSDHPDMRASSPITVFPAIRCARIFRSPAMSAAP